MNDLITINKIETLVTLYNNTISDLQIADEILDRVRRNMANALGEYNYYITEQRLPDSIYNINTIKKQFWSHIIHQSRIYSYISKQRKNEIESQFTSNELPDFTSENVWQFIQTYIENARNLVQETIEEVFNYLTPQHSDYKTNNRYEMGKKVIIERALGEYDRTLSYYKEEQFDSIDRLFHLLDGKGVPKYPNNLSTQLKDTTRKRADNIITEYFSIKIYYQARTIHMTFRRMDLVQQINAMVGKYRIKQEAA